MIDKTNEAAEKATLLARRDELLQECETLTADLDKYRDLFQFAPDMYGLLDVDTATVLECNHAMTEILGYERNEVVGRPLLNFHPPDLHESLQAMIESFRKTGELPEAEIEYQRKDGSRSPASSKVVAIRDETGRAVRARSVMRDITKSKQTELALRQNEERFRRLAEKIDVVPWEAQFTSHDRQDPNPPDDEYRDFRLTYFGPQSERVLCFTPEQCLRPGFWIEAVHPDDRPMLLEKLTALLESDDTLSVEYRVIAGDGRTVWVLNRCNVIRHRTGPSRMTGVLIDITDRKVISDRRQRVMRELDHRVKNTLAVVSAIADRTNKPATTLSEFTFQLSSRVSALARIHTALSRHSWLGLTMEDLVSAACGDEPRMQIEGPSISIPLEIAQPLGMALCELVTNARTYGALSNETGRIAINWQVERLDAAGTLQIEWIEAGGPPVRASETRGCGLYLIEDVLRYEIDADVEMSFFEPGLRCTIAIPVPEP